jgi:hypothetical protein
MFRQAVQSNHWRMHRAAGGQSKSAGFRGNRVDRMRDRDRGWIEFNHRASRRIDLIDRDKRAGDFDRFVHYRTWLGG